MKRLVFFNNKGGVGKTSLAYHLSWMYREMGYRVVAADFDPQSNLTAMFLSEDRLNEIWPEDGQELSIMASLEPLIDGTGDLARPHVEYVDDSIGLLVGDLGLATVEDRLSYNWNQCLNRDPYAFRITSSFFRMVDMAAQAIDAEIALIDVGPNLGAINRAALVAADHVVIPLSPDLFSLQGLRNLGPTLREWRQHWNDRLARSPELPFALPAGAMSPAGYVVMQHAVRLDRPVVAYAKWMDRIPSQYRRAITAIAVGGAVDVKSDPFCLAEIKHYRSLMPFAMEARKPMFALKPADGAIGAHQEAVTRCYHDFRGLARRIGAQIGLPAKATA